MFQPVSFEDNSKYLSLAFSIDHTTSLDVIVLQLVTQNRLSQACKILYYSMCVIFRCFKQFVVRYIALACIWFKPCIVDMKSSHFCFFLLVMYTSANTHTQSPLFTSLLQESCLLELATFFLGPFHNISFQRSNYTFISSQALHQSGQTLCNQTGSVCLNKTRLVTYSETGSMCVCA